MAVTAPVALFMVAMAGLLLAHVPPLVVSVRVLPVPLHMVKEPVIVPALGGLLTVTVAVAVAVPQLLVTV